MNEPKKCGQCQREIPDHAPFGICPVCVLNLATEEKTNLKSDSNSSGPIDAPNPEELVGKFPNLEIVSALGRGGMGAVYLARQTSLDRIVALKVLSKGLADDPSFTERFAREAKTLAKLTHPNIVTVFDSGQSGDANYLVMEYIEGVNLRDAIVSKTIDPARALAIVQQICDALQHAHDAGVIHRDIKPENILIDRNGLVKIADFGLAKLIQPKPEQYSLTGTRQVLGTRNYMAPEQIETPESVDHRADLYSLGVVLYELLTGELPIGRFAPPSTKSGCSKRLDGLVMRTLEKDPSNRFQHASMIGSAVRELESSIGQTSGGPSLVEAITRTDLAGTIGRTFNEPLVDPLPFSISRLKSKPSSRSGNALRIAKARGLMHAYDDRIDLEYRIHDPMDGDEPKLKLDTIQLDDLSSVKFEPTWWGGGRLRFRAMSLSSVANIPKAKQGEFSVNVGQRDRGVARDFADVANRKIISRNPQRSGAKRKSESVPTVTLEDIVMVDERLKVPILGFWITGAVTLLAGIAATIAMVLSFLSPGVRQSIANIFGPEFPQVMFVVGPVWLLAWIIPLIAAKSLKHHRNYHLGIVALLVSLIPAASPLLFVPPILAAWALIVLGLPVTRRVFRNRSLQDRLAVAKKPAVIQRIPRWVFAAAVIGPFVFAGLIITAWTAASHAPPTSPAAFTAVAKETQSSLPSVQAEQHPEETILLKDVDAIHTQPALPRVATEPPTAFAPWSDPAPRVANPRSKWVPSSRPSNLKHSISTVGYIGIVFVVFVMLFLVLLLAMLSRNVIRAAKKLR